jgi:transcriptional regulator with XRE-family HTH domain
VRRQLGLKRYQFAQRLDVTKASAGNYERGQMPRADLLDRIAKLGRVRIEWLLHGTEHAESKSSKPFVIRAPKAIEAKLRQLPERYRRRYEVRARTLVKQMRQELEYYVEALQREYRGHRR